MLSKKLTLSIGFVALNLIVCFNNQLLSQEWYTNMDRAKSIAKSDQKPILLVFQGSDWCGPCIKLDKQVWSTPLFVAYAKEHLILLRADFPRRKKNRLSEEEEKHNQILAEKFNSNGIFPRVVLLTHEEQILGETGFRSEGAEKYIAHLDKLLEE